MTASTASASTLGRMAASMRATGTMASSMVMEFTARPPEQRDEDVGKKASAATGMTSSRTWTKPPRPNKYEQKQLLAIIIK